MDMARGSLHSRHVHRLAIPGCLLAISAGCLGAGETPAPLVAGREPPPEARPAPPVEPPPRLRQDPLQILGELRPRWRRELTVDEGTTLAAVDSGLLFYVDSRRPLRRAPHVLRDGRLVPVPHLGALTYERHEPGWREPYGRWPAALWRMADAGAGAVFEQWQGGRWRPLHRFSAGCDVSLVGPTWDGGLVVAIAGCAAVGERSHALFTLSSDRQERVGPSLTRAPFLALTTAEALYVVTFIDEAISADPDLNVQGVRRFACPPPHDCPPEDRIFVELPMAWPWLDLPWKRHWSGLARRDGVDIVHQDELSGVHVLAHDDNGWRSTRGPGWFTTLLAAGVMNIAVTLRPEDAPVLGDETDVAPTRDGNAVWVQRRGAPGWQPVKLPDEVYAATGVQIATDAERLWIADHGSPRAYVFSAPLGELGPAE